MRKGNKAKWDDDGNPYDYTVLQNLKDAGCTKETVQRFFEFYDQGEEEKQLRLLSQQRENLLRCLHRDEKRIDCLDYLVYRLQHKR